MSYDALEKVQMRIAQRLGHDCAISIYLANSVSLADYTDLCRILRVPGTTFLSDEPWNGPIGVTDADVRRRIIKHMGRKAITRKELARRIGVTGHTVGNWLSGKTIFRLQNYLDVCDALKVSHSRFFGWEMADFLGNHN